MCWIERLLRAFNGALSPRANDLVNIPKIQLV
jgi:hypothetical protein